MNIEIITNNLRKIIWICDSFLSKVNDEFFSYNKQELLNNIENIDQSFSQSWMGYQSRVYYENFQTPPKNAIFSSEYGLSHLMSNPTQGNWILYSRKEVADAVFHSVDDDFLDKYEELGSEAKIIFEEQKHTLSILLETISNSDSAKSIESLKNELEKIDTVISLQRIINYKLPKGQKIIRDPMLSGANIETPQHIYIQARLLVASLVIDNVKNLVKISKQIIKYLEINSLLGNKMTDNKTKNIFIGHGQSSDWKDLGIFIRDRLNLRYEEFNSVSTAGYTTVERLQEMMDNASFAFLIMTAEDEAKDGKLNARQNVIHEVGLFQGKLGFRKAIVLLESGCEEFSNIHGLTQIRFRNGEIKSTFEDVRQVLEREGII